jgi:hypothetical protein
MRLGRRRGFASARRARRHRSGRRFIAFQKNPGHSLRGSWLRRGARLFRRAYRFRSSFRRGRRMLYLPGGFLSCLGRSRFYPFHVQKIYPSMGSRSLSDAPRIKRLLARRNRGFCECGVDNQVGLCSIYPSFKLDDLYVRSIRNWKQTVSRQRRR